MTAPRKTRRGRGEGEIEELPSGSFRAVVSLGRDAQGKRERLKKTFALKKDALAWQRQKLAERDGGTLTASTITLGAWLDTWLPIRKEAAAASTYRTEKDTAERRLRPALAGVRLRDLNPLAVERWLQKLAADGVSANERRKAAKLLRQVCNEGVRRKVLGANPTTGVKIPKRPEAEGTGSLDAKQLAALLAAAVADVHARATGTELGQRVDWRARPRRAGLDPDGDGHLQPPGRGGSGTGAVLQGRIRGGTLAVRRGARRVLRVRLSRTRRISVEGTKKPGARWRAKPRASRGGSRQAHHSARLSVHQSRLRKTTSRRAAIADRWRSPGHYHSTGRT